MASVAFFGGCFLGVGLFVSMSEHVGKLTRTIYACSVDQSKEQFVSCQ